MKGFRKLLIVFLGLLAVFLVFLLWYQYRYSMDVVAPYGINSPSLEKKLLIATQGSEFKDLVTNGISNHYTSDSIYIKVIDVEGLSSIDPREFDALAIIHTWENWKPPAAVKAFINRTRKYKDKIIVVTTSGEGTYKMEGVDAIVGESILNEAPEKVDQIITRLEAIIN